MRLRRALDEEVAIALGMPDGELEVRLPRRRDAVEEREHVVRTEHVDGGRPQLGVAPRQRQRHVATVRTADDAGTTRVHSLVVRQHLGHRMHVVEPVLATPVMVDALHVVHPVARRAPHVGHEDREALERERLDERHREPREVRPLLALWPSVHVVDERPSARRTRAPGTAGTAAQTCAGRRGRRTTTSSPAESSAGSMPSGFSFVCCVGVPSASSTKSCVGVVAVQNERAQRPLSGSRAMPCSTPPASSPFAHEHAAELHSAGRFVEVSLIGPRDSRRC